MQKTSKVLNNVSSCLLEIIDDFCLLIELSYVHQALGKFSPTSVDYLVAHDCLSAQIHRLLYRGDYC